MFVPHTRESSLKTRLQVLEDRFSDRIKFKEGTGPLISSILARKTHWGALWKRSMYFLHAHTRGLLEERIGLQVDLPGVSGEGPAEENLLFWGVKQNPV